VALLQARAAESLTWLRVNVGLDRAEALAMHELFLMMNDAHDEVGWHAHVVDQAYRALQLVAGDV
jgi:hypothetical protein